VPVNTEELLGAAKAAPAPAASDKAADGKSDKAGDQA
jgi:hypothetical protein